MAIPIPNLNFLMDSSAPVGFQPPLQQQGQESPFSALETILNNLNNQPIAQAPPPSTLDRILTGFAQAASVAASNDPGQALSGLIKQGAARRDAQTQALQQRQNLVNQVRVQAGIEQARSLSEEQSKVRTENRANFRQIQSERREVAQRQVVRKEKLADYRDQKVTDIDIAKQEFEQSEELLTKYAPLRESRLRHETLIRDLPQQMERSASWQAIAELTDAGAQINRNDLKVIGDKVAGASQVPLTPLERQVLNNINEERRTKLDRKFEAEMRKTEAETDYILQGKPGSLSNAFERGYLGRLGSDMANKLDNVYVRLQNGAVVTPDEARQMGIQGMSAKPLTAEENARENQKRIEQIKQVAGASNAVGKPLTVDQTKIDKGKSIVTDATAKGRTVAQVVQILKANGFSSDEINLLLGTKLAPEAPKGTITVKPGQFKFGPQAQEDKAKAKSEADKRQKEAQKNSAKFQNFKN